MRSGRVPTEDAALELEILSSPPVNALLQRWQGDAPGDFRGVYDKWQGSHWVLLSLADIGYPRGRAEIRPLAEAVLSTWLGSRFFHEREVLRQADAYSDRGSIPVMQGRHRTCASQQGNALYSLLRLGVEDARLGQLAERLLHWQWPDGGWNCDKNPDAHVSTVVHTLWSMRGLGLYAEKTGSAPARQAVQRAAESSYVRKATPDCGLGNDFVAWGGVSSRTLNEWITADALYVAKAFGKEAEVR